VLNLLHTTTGLALLAVAACSPRPQVSAVYSGITRTEPRVLLRLDYDSDGDEMIDVRTYIRGGQPIRVEGDADGDGRVDRWEYYGADGKLLRVGAATRNDGREDTWTSVTDDEMHVAYSTLRDGVIDRVDIFRNDVLVRTERDVNHDGSVDTWEHVESGRLAMVLVDELHRGHPTRRVVYLPNGVRVEVDPDGDGRFEPASRPE
jgi:hypothetical protein